MREETDLGEALVVSTTRWRWARYSTPGPWDAHLGDHRPSHGWRRTRRLVVGAELWELTEWTFTRRRPADEVAVALHQGITDGRDDRVA